MGIAANRCRKAVFVAIAFLAVATTSLLALKPAVLQSIGGVPAHIAGRFREPANYQQSASGEYYVFDRRAHTVYGLDSRQSSAREIVRIGAEPGRIIDPTAFAVGPGGAFVVADAPGGRERVQLFSADGARTGGFFLPGRMKPRVTLDGAVINGIGSMQYDGRSILMSQPDTGALIAEFDSFGNSSRTIGQLRHTGHEDDHELHLALNSGIPLVDPTGGFFFVFQTGQPVFQKYDAAGRLVFERHVVGPEIDPFVAALPVTWPTRRTGDGEMPMVSPTVRTAAVDRSGRLWISFVVPYSYVYDAEGDKIRVVQFRGAGIIQPSSFFFTTTGRLLVTPGLLEFSSPNFS